ncbi:MAG: hypothetical protein U1E05_02975 [Patescibacteria group bacterium]|nr:hypothetical protein [Patescibacteria group bacterium]
MWRAFFLAMGIYLVLGGLQCLGVESATLVLRNPPPKATSFFEEAPKLGSKKSFVPPPWTPWSLMSTGAVVCLYSFTLPKRIRGE